jgi:hypothetical protein
VIIAGGCPRRSVGQAQLWNVKAVPKQPVLAVAAYSALLLASLIAFGAARGAAYEALPKWRRKAYRPCRVRHGVPTGGEKRVQGDPRGPGGPPHQPFRNRSFGKSMWH